MNIAISYCFLLKWTVNGVAGVTGTISGPVLRLVDRGGDTGTATERVTTLNPSMAGRNVRGNRKTKILRNVLFKSVQVRRIKYF